MEGLTGASRSTLRSRRAGLILGAAGAAALGVAGWGWFEAGWVRLRTLAVPVAGLPEELRGLRIAHLSDFHLGVHGRGGRSSARAVEWAAGRRPDLVVVSGDLLTRPSGEPLLRDLIERLPNCYAILGNHDFAISRDPGARRSYLDELAPATLLSDNGVFRELRGRRIYVAGSDPRSRFVRSRPRARELAVGRDEADLRILLCHYPFQVDTLPPGAFDLVLAGHMHDGQICVPYPGGKLRLAHPGARYSNGVYLKPAGTLHVSPGLGTTFVPFRLFSRPEATELVLEPA